MAMSTTPVVMVAKLLKRSFRGFAASGLRLIATVKARLTMMRPAIINDTGIVTGLFEVFMSEIQHTDLAYYCLVEFVVL